MSELALHPADAHGVDTHDHGHHAPAVHNSTRVWSGKIFMWLFLCQDALAFFGLFAAYISVRIGAGHMWPLPEAGNPIGGIEPNPLNINLTALNTFLLICSSVTMVYSLKAITEGDHKGMLKWLSFTILGGSIFLGIQFYEYNHLINEALEHVKHQGLTHAIQYYSSREIEGLRMHNSLFDASFFILTCFHGCHVLAGVLYLSALAFAAAVKTKWNGMTHSVVTLVICGLLLFALRFGLHNYFSFDLYTATVSAAIFATMFLMLSVGMRWLVSINPLPRLVENAGLYWHFVDLVWIILFTLVYLI